MALFKERFAKEGKGVEKKEKAQNPFLVFFEILKRKIWKFSTINLVYLFIGLPTWLFMVIVGLSFQWFHNGNQQYLKYIPYLLILTPFIALISSPATMGVTFVLRNFSREKHAWVPGDIFEKASKNYLQGMIIGFINSLIGFLFTEAYFFYMQTPNLKIFGYIVLVLGCIFLMMRNYIYPLAVTYNMKIGEIYRNSIALTFIKLPQNILILALCIGMVYFSFYYIGIGILLMATILLSILGYITNYYCNRVIKVNIVEIKPKEYEEIPNRPYK